MSSETVSIYELSEVYVKSLQRLLNQILQQPNIDSKFREQVEKLQKELEYFVNTIDNEHV